MIKEYWNIFHKTIKLKIHSLIPLDSELFIVAISDSSNFLFFPFFFDTVNVDIYFFIVETYSSGNGDALRSGIFIPPNIILIFLVVKYDAIIIRLSFIWT